MEANAREGANGEIGLSHLLRKPINLDAGIEGKSVTWSTNDSRKRHSHLPPRVTEYDRLSNSQRIIQIT
jgi:hypothetical protein